MKIPGWIVAVGVIALAIVIEGSVLSVLWKWFMIPLGLGPLGTAHAIGLAALIGLVTHQHNPRPVKPHSEMTDEERLRSGKALMMHLFVRPCIVLLIGYVAHWRMMA